MIKVTNFNKKTPIDVIKVFIWILPHMQTIIILSFLNDYF